MIPVIAVLLLSLVALPAGAWGQEGGEAVDQTLRELRQEIRDLRDEVRLMRQVMERRLSEGRGEAEEPLALVSIDDDPMLGRADAPVTIIEFSDYQCPFCGEYARKTLPQIKASYIDTGQVRYVYRDFPLSNIHQQAEQAAVAAVCAGRQGKYWEMHDKLYESQAILKNEPWDALVLDLGLERLGMKECMKEPGLYQEVRQDMEDGRAAGVAGTPTFFIGLTDSGKLIEGKILKGALPFEAFRAEIDALLSKVTR